MATTAATAPARCLVLSWQSIHQLRQVLERDAGMQAATWLQEAGFAGGEALAAVYTEWLAERYNVGRPASLDVRHLGETLSGFFQEHGWGMLEVSPLTPAVLALDSTDWWEAEEQLRAALLAAGSVAAQARNHALSKGSTQPPNSSSAHSFAMQEA